MPDIRSYRPDDLEALYRIALATGDAGADAAGLYQDPRLVGHIFAAPYAVLSPATALVAEDDHGVAGYIVGAADTRAFEALLESDWWPPLRRVHDQPTGPPHTWNADERMRWLIHHPPRAPTHLVSAYPAHLHINLLPRIQGQGIGRRLIDRWLAIVRKMGSIGAHLGVNTANTRAIGFYRRYGLVEPVLARPPPPGVIWFAATLA